MKLQRPALLAQNPMLYAAKVVQYFKFKIMLVILSKSDLIRLDQSESRQLNIEDFKIPMSVCEMATDVVYLNGDNRQVLKTRNGHSTAEQLQGSLVWKCINGMSYEAAKQFLFDIQSQLQLLSFVKAEQ